MERPDWNLINWDNGEWRGNFLLDFNRLGLIIWIQLLLHIFRTAPSSVCLILGLEWQCLGKQQNGAEKGCVTWSRSFIKVALSLHFSFPISVPHLAYFENTRQKISPSSVYLFDHAESFCANGQIIGSWLPVWIIRLILNVAHREKGNLCCFFFVDIQQILLPLLKTRSSFTSDNKEPFLFSQHSPGGRIDWWEHAQK